MIIYGAGGHARVVFNILNACGETVSAIFDDNFQKKELQSFPVTHAYSSDFFQEELLIIAIGNNLIRRQISLQISHRFGNAIHPSALVAPDVVLKSGIAVMHNAVVQSGSTIGDHVIINTGALIDHDCVIENYVHIAPGAILCGSVRIGQNTLLGAGCTIIPNIRVGNNCIIGAGSVVISDIPDNVTVYGNPARIFKLKDTL